MRFRTHWIVAAIVLLALTARAPAQSYPTKQITIVVSLAAGSGMDTITRLYAEKLSEALGKPVIVENKPGAATTLAAQQVAAAAPDGHTLVVLTSIALSINPTLFKKLNYDPHDLEPISLYLKSPFILAVNPELPAKTLPEFAEFAKKRLGFDATHVPYRSTPQSVTDLIAGHVSASFLEAGLSIPLVKDGKLRALAVSSAERLPLLPDVPPFAEASGAKDYEGGSWHMLLMPAKTPRAIVEQLHAEMKKIMLDPHIREKISALGYIPNESPSIEDMRGYIELERLKWGSMVKELGLEGSQ